MTALAPPFPYFGGKQRVADRIVALFPEHEAYVEPYCGGLSVLLAKRPSKIEVVNDLDGDIVTFWRVLRDRPLDLERACALTPHSRAEHALSRDRDDADMDDVERARRVWVALTQGRAGQIQRTGWRYYIDPRGTTVSMPGYLSGYVERMPPAARRLRSVSLECRPALEVIAAYGAHERTLLYVDPPYLGATRGTTTAYRREMRGEDDHRALAEALHACRAAVVLSGYAHPLYDGDLFADWDRVEISAYSGNAASAGRSHRRAEVLWSNRALHRQGALDLDEEATA